MKALIGLAILAGAATLVPVPEPAALLLSGGLLFGLAGALRRLPI